MPETKITIKDISGDIENAGKIACYDETTGEFSARDSSFDEIIKEGSGHIVVKDGGASISPIEPIKDWTPETSYEVGSVVLYRNLLFRYNNPKISGTTISEDFGYIECLSPQAKIIQQLNHGFLNLAPVYFELGVKSTSLQSFTTVGTTSWIAPSNATSVDVLIIGGGGGGGRYYTNLNGIDGGSGAGGGAGTQRYYQGLTITPNSSYTVIVGAGGLGSTKYVSGSSVVGDNATNGSASSFGAFSASGGTRGGGTGSQDIGGSNADYTGCGASGGSWGGGAGSGASATGKNGGSGKYCNITGTNIVRGGGGGSLEVNNSGTTYGGSGGGGTGGQSVGGVPVPATNGTVNTGSGGGGGGTQSFGEGGDGGSGLVIIKCNMSTDLWKLAKSNNISTLASHIVLESSANHALIVNSGQYNIPIPMGYTSGRKYVSDSQAGVVVDTDTQTISNPAYILEDECVTILTGLLTRTADRYIDNWINGYSSLVIGGIIPYAGIACPDGYMFCDGSEVLKTIYSELYSVIGDRYGTPILSQNFVLPNLKGRVPVGQDISQTEFDTIGETGGAKTHTLTIAQMPSHNHTYSPFSGGTGSASAYMQTSNRTAITATFSSTGGGGSHNNLQPYQTTNYIIKYRKDELGDNGGTGVNTGDETKATIEAKLTGEISSHTHHGLGENEESFVLLGRIDKITAGDEVISLDGNLYDIIKIYCQSANSTTTTSHIFLKLNNDGGANYKRQTVNAIGTTVGGTYAGANTNAILSYSYGVVGGTTSSEFTIFPKVTGCARQMQAIRAFAHTNLTTLYSQIENHIWSNTGSNITTLNFSGFVAGCKHIITVFGRRANYSGSLPPSDFVEYYTFNDKLTSEKGTTPTTTGTLTYTNGVYLKSLSVSSNGNIRMAMPSVSGDYSVSFYMKLGSGTGQPFSIDTTGNSTTPNAIINITNADGTYNIYSTGAYKNPTGILKIPIGSWFLVNITKDVNGQYFYIDKTLVLSSTSLYNTNYLTFGATFSRFTGTIEIDDVKTFSRKLTQDEVILL